MSMTPKAKVSSVVTYQVPEFVREDSPHFHEFLAHYYKFMEQENQPLDIIRKTVDNLDVDKTQQEFLDIIKRHVLPYNLNNAEAVISDEMLIKFLRELYLAKGTEKSYNFVFNNLYNADIDMAYGKNYVFRLSDNEYPGFDTVLLRDYIGDALLYGLAGNYIKQLNGSALVDQVKLYQYSSLPAASFTGDLLAGSNIVRNVSNFNGILNGTVVTDPQFILPKGTQVVGIDEAAGTLTLSNAARENRIGIALEGRDAYYLALIKSNDFDGVIEANVPTTGTIDNNTLDISVIPVITGMTIRNSGALYTSGQPLEVIGGSGSSLKVEIGDVGPGGVEGIYIEKPGTGYETGQIITFNDPSGQGLGAKAIITSVDGAPGIMLPRFKIHDLLCDLYSGPGGE